ncbi:ATP-binding cassette domain-containing protein [Flavobacteriaceae bacterium Ap0902]|nr:ATP-binding cassette domain-containing protein [Flavobacteriaceae bacterium Ap0902]
MIEFKKVTKKYNNNIVFDNFSKHFENNKIYHLTGRNGSGKSTMLQMIAGLVKPQKGQLIFSDKDFKKKTSFLFHEPLFIKDLSILDNVKLHFYIMSLTNIDLEYLEFLSSMLVIPLDERIDTFSKGMKKKAEILISISHKPIYCIWDEPFDGIDEESIQVIKRNILSNFEFGIISSHLISPSNHIYNLSSDVIM